MSEAPHGQGAHLHPDPAEPGEAAADPSPWAERVGGLAYGLIAVAALLAAESSRRETLPRTTAAVVVTMVLYWLAHAYAGWLAARVGNRSGAADLLRHLRDEVWLLAGGVPPLAAVLITAVTGAGDPAAVTAGLVAAAGSLVALEIAAGLRGRPSRAAAVVEVAVGSVLGLAVLALRVLLH